LLLRRPEPADAQAILDSYAGDIDVTRLLAWPRHRSLDDTEAFLRWSEQVWSTHDVGPYLVVDSADSIIGTTGLDIETPFRAATGYVLARRAWGVGYATELATAMVSLAENLGVRRVYALCHPDNQASSRVLQKAGFDLEGVLRRHTVFPNHDPGYPHDVQCWARITPAGDAADPRDQPPSPPR
jgi:RimJ/RimL family protein N-acetyltransferase